MTPWCCSCRRRRAPEPGVGFVDENAPRHARARRQSAWALAVVPHRHRKWTPRIDLAPAEPADGGFVESPRASERRDHGVPPVHFSLRGPFRPAPLRHGATYCNLIYQRPSVIVRGPARRACEQPLLPCTHRAAERPARKRTRFACGVRTGNRSAGPSKPTVCVPEYTLPASTTRRSAASSPRSRRLQQQRRPRRVILLHRVMRLVQPRPKSPCEARSAEACATIASNRTTPAVENSARRRRRCRFPRQPAAFAASWRPPSCGYRDVCSSGGRASAGRLAGTASGDEKSIATSTPATDHRRCRRYAPGQRIDNPATSMPPARRSRRAAPSSRTLTAECAYL